MKKLILICLSVFLFSCAEKPKAIITAQLANLEDQEVYIMEVLGGDTKLTTTHTANSVDGVFTFVLDDTTPRRANIKFEKSGRYFYAIIEEGTLSIVGDFEKNTSAKISGTFIADKQLELKARQRPLNVERNKLNTKMRAIIAKGKEENMSSEETNALLSPLRERSSAITVELKEVEEQFVEENKDNIFYVFSNTIQSCHTVRDLKAQMDKIPTSLQDNGFYAYLKRRLEALSKVDAGAMAPDFTTKTIDGEPFTLSSTRGKVVLLNAWAST